VLSDLRWKNDVEMLVGAIQPHLPRDARAVRRLPRRLLLVAAAVIALLLAVLLLWRLRSTPDALLADNTRPSRATPTAQPSGAIPKALEKRSRRVSCSMPVPS